MDEDDEWAARPDFLTEVMLATYERRRFQTELINEMPLYPTERLLWDENQVPSAHYTGGDCQKECDLLQPHVCELTWDFA